MTARPAARPTLARKLAGVALVASALPAMILTSSSAAAPSFLPSERVPGARGFEQGINVLPDGTIFLDEPAGLPSHSNLWRLDPGETQFKKLVFPTPYGRLPGGGDSDVAVTADGRVYFLDLWVGSNSIAVSEDRGETWTLGTPFTTFPLTDRQWIALGKRDPSTGKDTVYAVYQQINVPNWVMFSRSRDGGLTWDYHRPAPFLTGGVSGATGKLVSDGDFLAFSYDTAGGQMYVATSHDAGETWDTQPATPLNNADRTITGTALAGQHLYTAWITRAPATVQFGRSTQRGAEGSWDFPVKVATVNGTAVFSWIAARGNKVAIAWYETPTVAAGPNDVGPNAEWTVKYVESLDKGTTWSTPVAVTGVVKRGIICTNGLGCTSGREVGDFLTLTIDPQGKSIIAYYEGGGGRIVRQA